MSDGRRVRSATPPPPPEPAGRRGLRSRIGGASRWWALAIGLLVGRIVVDAPEVVRQSFDALFFLGLAFLVARSYRRWAREQLRRRREQRGS
ncbi:MAG TPA: hypothetical protein QF624_11655 [Dehalococcoidia bacterium]|nr:hypothetical protein [Dehalococcoidia bacterium]